jgi:uncharacterized membrane protein
MLVLYLALRYIERHATDYELIEIDGDQLKVEQFEGGRTRTQALSRHWARVVVSRDGTRLALRSHGREFEIGCTLNDAQRLELAQALTRRLRGTR